MKRNRLDEVVTTILNQHDEELCWSLYLASVANPLSDTGSFDDFLKKYKAPAIQKKPKTEQGVNNRQIQKQLDRAEKLLAGFAPPVKGGS